MTLPWNMSRIVTFSVEHRDGSKISGADQKETGMSYEVAISPLLALVFIIIACMAILCRFVPHRFHEAIIGAVVAGVMIQFIILLPIWVVYI
jgi:uncharacterized BrkB/YihY/UPF0761 family membrane protein